MDQRIYGSSAASPSREAVMEGFVAYCEEQMTKGIRLNYMTRHILGLYQGMPGARRFRRTISEHAHKPNADIKVIYQAMAAMSGVDLKPEHPNHEG